MINTDNIINTVNELVNMVNELSINPKITDHQIEIMILEKYPEFYDMYPYLVKKICKKQDISMFYKMISGINKINTEQDTLHNVEKTLGDELANTFLYPNLK